jgi:protein-disulfide isomerase
MVVDSSPRKAALPAWLWYVGAGGLIVAVSAYLVSILMNQAPPVTEERLAQEAWLGRADAPIEIIEYGAYGCHSCRQVHQSGVLRQVLEQYEGEVRFVFRNYPVIRPNNDPLAAQAAQCALDQGDEAFWAYHEALFDLSDASYAQHDTNAEFVKVAQVAGIDAKALEICLEERTHETTVSHWRDIANDLNLLGTPTFFVNGRRLNDPSQLSEVISQTLEGES